MPESKSGDEVERVFKVRRIPENLDQYPSEKIVQGYLTIERDGAEVRLRKIDECRVESYKGSGRLQRREIEIELSRDQFDALWPATEGRRIEKVRYKIDWRGHTIELNVYQGKLEGLALAEIEFPSRGESESFEPPDWLGEDVTEDKRYKNQNLARKGPPKGAVTRPR
jgi:adenylate cyclase